MCVLILLIFELLRMMGLVFAFLLFFALSFFASFVFGDRTSRSRLTDNPLDSSDSLEGLGFLALFCFVSLGLGGSG